MSYPVITCSRCGLEGHNINGCVSQGVPPKRSGWVPPPPPPPLLAIAQPMGFGQATFDPIPTGIRPPPVRGPNPIARNATIYEEQMLTSFMPSPRFNPRGPRP
ncbi:hypothetical protein TSUD_153340 [Trifolium subterraneum]|uniref:Uncharacterized protein n=1 Tax=Trifolium subterraneum TaxID=3900 RepID=A0A2Z6NHT1_TRISU|nr:hypothetical protein TSUD_153340 [Trifolium subterraneum]